MLLYACSGSVSTFMENFTSTYFDTYSTTYVNFPSNTACTDDFDYLENCVDRYPEKPALLYSRS